MSYVSIWKPVNDRIVQASRESKDEIIGLLLGRLQRNTLIIDDSITGEFQGEPNRVTLSPSALAKIADDLLNDRSKGNIVGWYHSHTDAGLGFSETDVRTQKILQQFSSLIAGMVIDADTGEVGYFRVDETGEAYRIRNEKITVFEKPSEAVRPEMNMEPLNRIEWTLQRPPRQQRPNQGLYTVAIIVCVVLAIAATVVIIVLVFHAKFTSILAIAPLHSGFVPVTVR